MILYHFSTSPFARRVRLVLAHKGVSAELRDPRTHPEYVPEVQALSPMHTVPVLVDGERTIVDSTAIVHYVDRKWPQPPVLSPPPLAPPSATHDTPVPVKAEWPARFAQFG